MPPPITLTEREVRELRARLLAGKSRLIDEAQHLGVNVLTISRIAAGEIFHTFPKPPDRRQGINQRKPE